MKIKIVIADDEPITRMDIREMLEDANYEVVGEASDGFEAIEQCKKHSPDLVLMDIKMPLLDGLSASKIISEERLAGAIMLITAYSGADFIEKAKRVDAIGYIVKPVDEKSLIPNIEVAMARSKELNKLKTQLKKTAQKLEDRKLIEKAKGIVMAQKNISEKDAYEYIRTLSMNKRIFMRDIAQIIIRSNDEYEN